MWFELEKINRFGVLTFRQEIHFIVWHHYLKIFLPLVETFESYTSKDRHVTLLNTDVSHKRDISFLCYAMIVAVAI